MAARSRKRAARARAWQAMLESPRARMAKPNGWRPARQASTLAAVEKNLARGQSAREVFVKIDDRPYCGGFGGGFSGGCFFFLGGVAVPFAPGAEEPGGVAAWGLAFSGGVASFGFCDLFGAFVPLGCRVRSPLGPVIPPGCCSPFGPIAPPGCRSRVRSPLGPLAPFGCCSPLGPIAPLGCRSRVRSLLGPLAPFGCSPLGPTEPLVRSRLLSPLG